MTDFKKKFFTKKNIIISILIIFFLVLGYVLINVVFHIGISKFMLKKEVSGMGYTILNIDGEKSKKIDKTVVDIVKNGRCDNELVIKLEKVADKLDKYTFYAYKNLFCKVLSENLIEIKYNFISGDHLGYTKIDYDYKLYKREDGIIENIYPYDFLKDLGNNYFVLSRDSYKYIFTTGSFSNNGLIKVKKIENSDNIYVYSSGSIAEITILDKNSTTAQKIIFNKKNYDKKYENLAQVSCNKSGKCIDEVKKVLSNLKVKKDYFGGSIIGNIVKGQIKKVIITPEKNKECKLDLEPYELKKFDTNSGEFKYNFALKYKNICPKSGAKFNIDLIGTDDKKYHITKNVEGPFYEEKYKNLRFVKEKNINKINKDSNSEILEIKYKGFLKNDKTIFYVYMVLIDYGMIQEYLYYYTDKKINNFDKVFKKSISELEKDKYRIISKIYSQENINIDIDKDKLEIKNINTSNFYNEILYDLYKYNFNYKKVEILGYKNLYEKDGELFVKGKYNLMIPVTVVLKNNYLYKIDNKVKKQEDYLYLKNNNKNLISLKANKNLEKIGKIKDLNVFQNKLNGCLFVSFKESKNYGLQYDFYSKNLKINFDDNKDYGDYTFRFAGQASEIYEKSKGDEMRIKYLVDTSSLSKCYHQVKEEDLKPEKRLEKIGEYAGFPIYKFKDSNDLYLKRRFREQYGVERGEEKGERYEEYVKSLPVLYWHDPFGRWIRVIKMIYIPQAEKMKPVIYLYPEKTMAINVQIKPNGGFKLTIPEYPKNEGWNVISTQKSEIVFKGKKYPYLFWEGKALGYEMGKKGFVIKNNTKEIENFLIEKLTKLGLNEKEIKDFNEYWIDKLLKVENPYIFITFASKKQQDFDSPLKITPKPDSIIRVFMDYKGLDEKEEVEKLKIKTPPRKGFTVVEWGGAKRW